MPENVLAPPDLHLPATVSLAVGHAVYLGSLVAGELLLRRGPHHDIRNSRLAASSPPTKPPRRRGGRRHVVLTCISLALWLSAVTSLIALPPKSHGQGSLTWIMIAATLLTIAWIVLIKSFLAFDMAPRGALVWLGLWTSTESNDARRLTASPRKHHQRTASDSHAMPHASTTASSSSASYVVAAEKAATAEHFRRASITAVVFGSMATTLGVLLLIMGTLLEEDVGWMLSSSSAPPPPPREEASRAAKVTLHVLALICLVLGIHTTHGLGGWLRSRSMKDALDEQLDQEEEQEVSMMKKKTMVVASPPHSPPPSSPPTLFPSLSEPLLMTPSRRIHLARISPPSARAWREWRYFQPFRGGSMFVLTQALGWALFAVGLTLSLALLRCQWSLSLFRACPSLAAEGWKGCVRMSSWGVALVFAIAHVLITVSLWAYGGEGGGGGGVAVGHGGVVEVSRGNAWTRRQAFLTAAALFSSTRASHRLFALPSPPRLARFRDCCHATLLLILLYLPVHLFLATILIPMMLLPTWRAVITLHASWLLPYAYFTGWLTKPGSDADPHHTGSRAWPAIQQWVTRYLPIMGDLYLGGIRIIRDSSSSSNTPPPPASTKSIFAYAPHGLYPIGAGYFPLHPDFARLFPHLQRPLTLTANAMYLCPLLRDVITWAGARRVSRNTLHRALLDQGSVLLVPGGQQELVLTSRAHTTPPSCPRPQVVLCTRHRGFVRAAVEHRAALYPVLCFNEIHQLRNIVNWPRLQQWSYKAFGFPIPYIVAGRGLLPWPRTRRGGVVFVVGEPILCDPALNPPRRRASRSTPTDAIHDYDDASFDQEELIEYYHREFYLEMQRLWDKHKVACGNEELDIAFYDH